MSLSQLQPDEHYSVANLTTDTPANTQIIGDNTEISDFNL
jgi:hypothetical protein